MIKKANIDISSEEFEKLFASVCNWGKWGSDDDRGTLNYITPAHIVAAAQTVKSGRSVSLSLPVNTTAGPDNARPAAHYMVNGHDVDLGYGEQRFAVDYLASEIHGDSITHMDALCHVSYKGKLYNGKPAASVTSSGATVQDITAFAHGIVGRGVLIDIPRLLGVKWLEPGHAVSREEIEAAEQAQGVQLGEGDIMLFRTGHHRRRLELGPWDCSYEGIGMAGLDPYAIPLLHERKVSVFLPDGDGETVPSRVQNELYPIHTLQLVSMGMVCADSLQFEELVEVCEEVKRWEFMVVASPLRIPNGTGSLFNPIAIF